MVKDVSEIGGLLAQAGCTRIIAHVETLDSATKAQEIFDSWRKNGAREIGIAILADTPLETLEAYSDLCQSVTVMSIASIGKQGIPFDERAYGRVADLHARYPDLVIEVDGGVSETQIATLARAGATRFSVGSAIAKASDPAAMYQKLKTIAESAIQ